MLASAILRKTRVLRQHQQSLQHIAILFSGKAGVQIIGLISQPILARLYTPSQFGEFAVLNSILAILLVASSGRYECGIILAKKEQHARRLFQLCQLMLIAYLLIISGFIFISPSGLEFLTNGQAIPDFYFWLIPLLILCAGYWQIVENWLIRFRKYSQLSFALLAQRIIILAGALLAFYLPFNANGLIIGQLIGFLAIFLFALYLQREPIRTPKRSVKAYSHAFRDFPYYSVPSLFILLFVYHLPVLWINFFFSQELTGHYNMAFTLVMLPITALSMGVGDIYYERLVKSNTQRQYKLIQNSFYLVSLMLLPCSLLLFFQGEALTVLLLGAKWQQAGFIVSLLSPLVLFQGLSSCLTIPLNIYRKQSLSLLFQILKLVLWVTALGIGYYFNDIFLAFIWVSFLSLLHLVIIALVVLPIIKEKHSGSLDKEDLSPPKSIG